MPHKGAYRGKLAGKHVYVTGGTGGIGTPLVRMLQQAGADVEVHGFRKDGDLVAGLERLSQQLSQNPPDILINLAGCHQFAFCEDQDQDRLLDLNLKVPMRLTQAVLPAMKQRNSGQIVFVGSMVGFIPLPHLTGYVAAKAGLKAFHDALRRELADTNVTTNFIAPRAVQTSMNAGIADEVNRLTGTKADQPEAVAACILKTILENRNEMRLGWPERFFAFLHAIFPGMVDRGLSKTRKVGVSLLQEKAAMPETQMPSAIAGHIEKEITS